MSPIVDLNGELVSAEQASMPVTDMAVLYGIGLFETMRAYGGKVFRLQQHLARLVASAEALGLPITPEMMPDEARLQRLLSRNALTDARIRLTVSGGSPASEGLRHTVLVTAVPLEPYPPEYYDQGVTVQITSQRQSSADPLAGHKTTCYWTRLTALHTAQLRGCAEALWFNDDNALAEGSISNVFVVANGTVLTPPLDTPVLPGITRGAVLELCMARSIPCQERTLTIDDLLSAEEVFVTNALMEIVPVVRIERKAVGTERVGDLTRQLASAYRALITEQVETP